MFLSDEEKVELAIKAIDDITQAFYEGDMVSVKVIMANTKSILMQKQINDVTPDDQMGFPFA